MAAGTHKNSRVRLGLLALLVCVLSALLVWRIRRSRTVTFVEVAPVFYRHCAPCHRPGESAPFSLLTFRDTHRRAAQIRQVLNDRYMPPWKPTPGVVHYRNERVLPAEDRALLDRWIAAGAPEGNPREVPPQPTWPRGWQLGTPSLELTLSEPYELYADGPDRYRNFVLRLPRVGNYRVAAWEFRPNSRAVHHAILFVDRMGVARRLDAADPAPGFDGMNNVGFSSPDGFYLVWAPGQIPSPPRAGASWRIDPSTELVLELHLHPTGRVEQVRPTIALYFTNERPTEQRLTLRLGDGPIEIPPGDRDWVLRDSFTLPAPLQVLGLFPHAHFLGRRLYARADLPDGSMRWLLHIEDWDPAWQADYYFQEPLLLPQGTRLSLEYHYDNSSENERNPNNPPRTVRTGWQSNDEMGNLTLSVLPTNAQGFLALQEFKFRRALDHSGPSAYNLANVLVQQGRIDEAVTYYQQAIHDDPLLEAAHFNLGNVELGRRAFAAAIVSYRRALELRPEHAHTHANLSHALRNSGNLPEAIQAAQRAIELDASSLPARVALAQALDLSGDVSRAATAWQQAIALEPNNPTLRALAQRTQPAP